MSVDWEALKKRANAVGIQLAGVDKMMKEKVPMAGQMHKIIPPGETKTARILHDEYTEEEVLFDNVAAAVKDRPDRVCPPGKYTRLLTKQVPQNATTDGAWLVMMSDAPYEIRSSMEFIENAKGDVLVAGLGIGATLVPVLRKTSVKSVTVIEKNPDVITLVHPHLRRVRCGDKLTVVEGDALAWAPMTGKQRGRRWDAIWLDIWPSIDMANLLEMQLLRKKYRKYLRKGGWIGVWEWDYLHQEKANYDEKEKLIYGCVGGSPEMLKAMRTVKIGNVKL